MGLIGSFLGTDQKKDLQRAKGAADTALQTGYNSAQGDYSNAMQSYDPYVQVGQQGIADQSAYSDILNNRGDAVSKFSSNPLFSGELASNYMSTQRAGNAAGWGAGKEALAGQRVFGQTAGSWLDRYAQNAQQGVQTGLQATNAQANAMQGRGDLAMNYGATRAGNEVNYGNAQAANRSVGINNLMGLGSLAVSAYTGIPTPKKAT